ncbi:MAG: DUF3368 domain-containing protein [Candidatus Magnetoovum sp. WYHC-5]|nr:DUF3368 domain-containing protein [Candidatus Magnetoovum sp. WYHC-5]
MKIVSDSSPIISFAKIKNIALLRQVLKKIIVPKAVYDEIVNQGYERFGAIEIEKADWIEIIKINNYSKINKLRAGLGLGERESIVLAEELEAILLINDRLGRQEAENRGITCFGTLRVLKEAKKKGFIKKIKPLIDELMKQGLYLKDSVYLKFLKDIGE